MAKRTNMIGIKVTEETRDKIEYLAGKDARSISSYINLILQEYLAKTNEFNNENWREDLAEQRRMKEQESN